MRSVGFQANTPIREQDWRSRTFKNVNLVLVLAYWFRAHETVYRSCWLFRNNFRFGMRMPEWSTHDREDTLQLGMVASNARCTEECARTCALVLMPYLHFSFCFACPTVGDPFMHSNIHIIFVLRRECFPYQRVRFISFRFSTSFLYFSRLLCVVCSTDTSHAETNRNDVHQLSFIWLWIPSGRRPANAFCTPTCWCSFQLNNSKRYFSIGI